MRGLSRLFVCGVTVALAFAGCGTPAQRASQHPAALQKLSPANQQMVLHGDIRPGLSRDGVYIAWGEPDSKVMGGKGHEESETWIYRHRLTISEPFDSYDSFGPRHGLRGYPSARLWQPGYPGGGIGYEGALFYQPHYRTFHTERVVVFGGSAGEVDRYKAENGIWSRPPPAPSQSSATALALTPAHPRAVKLAAHSIVHKTSQVRAAKIDLHSNRQNDHRHLVAVAKSHRTLHATTLRPAKSKHATVAQTVHSGAHATRKSVPQTASGSHLHHAVHAHGVAAQPHHARAT